jgi:transcriptional regulator with XRE-family HTH domain
MGWPERPLRPGGEPAAQLAYEMVKLRRKAGLSLKELAKLTNYTVSALSRAANEKEASSWSVTISYITNCELVIGDVSDPEHWKFLWTAANPGRSMYRQRPRHVE